MITLENSCIPCVDFYYFKNGKYVDEWVDCAIIWSVLIQGIAGQCFLLIDLFGDAGIVYCVVLLSFYVKNCMDW